MWVREHLGSLVDWEQLLFLTNLTHSYFFDMFFPVYAIAELIDNALSATAKNTGVRTIEIRMVCSTATYQLEPNNLTLMSHEQIVQTVCAFIYINL